MSVCRSFNQIEYGLPGRQWRERIVPTRQQLLHLRRGQYGQAMQGVCARARETGNQRGKMAQQTLDGITIEASAVIESSHGPAFAGRDEEGERVVVRVE